MLARHLSAAGLLLALSSVPAVAADPCFVVTERIQSGAQALQSDAENRAMSFIDVRPVVDSVLAVQKALAEAAPRSPEAVKAVSAFKDTLTAWAGKTRAWASDLTKVFNCREARPPCDSKKALARVSPEVRAWAGALRGQPDEIELQLEVASSILEHYATRLEGKAEGSLHDAFACLDKTAPMPADPAASAAP